MSGLNAFAYNIGSRKRLNSNYIIHTYHHNETADGKLLGKIQLTGLTFNR